MPACFLVVGTPRSGTSCVAGVLHHLGVFMGDRLMKANPMNEAGFFQDVEFEELFDDLAEWMPISIEHEPGHPRLEKLQSLVRKRCSLNVDWGVKFRHAPHVLGDFVAVCDQQVSLIVTSRAASESVASLAAWSDEHEQNPAEVIRRSRAAVDRATNSGLPVLRVDFDRLLVQSKMVVGEIAEFIGRDVNSTAIAFVQPALRRYG